MVEMPLVRKAAIDFLFLTRKGKIRILLDVRAWPGVSCIVSPFASKFTLLPVACDVEALWVSEDAGSFERVSFEDGRE